MKKLNVIFHRNEKNRFPVGQLAEAGSKIYFEYDSTFLADPLWLSPFKLPPQPGLHEHSDLNFGPLFGLFDDSLPDGWGLLLMDRHFRKKGIDVHRISILDRLAFLGRTTRGALSYEPALPHDAVDTWDFDLQSLARQSMEIIEGRSDTVFPKLMRAGGSPGGARPKVLVGVYGDQIISGEDELPPQFDHWIVKFNSKNDLPDAGPVEYAYSLMASAAGIVFPETRLFASKGGDSFFGIRRFDRKDSHRFHVHTLGNMLHVSHRIPSMDYEGFFKVIRILTENHKDVLEGFTRMIFNFLSNNRDDHVKNFAFMLGDEREWELTPAYDVTHSEGPGGEHSMTLAGEGLSPGKKEIMTLGKGAGLSKNEIDDSLERVLDAVHSWTDFASSADVTRRSISIISRSIERNIKAL